MNWLFLSIVITGAAALGFLLGWELCRDTARVEAQIEAVRANLTRPASMLDNYGAWRYRVERNPSASRRILGPRERAQSERRAGG